MRMLLFRFCLGFAACLPLAAQPPALPAFEVASVKPSVSPGPARLTTNPETWSCLNCRLFDLFGHAYKVFEYQIVAPGWTKGALFDVIAKLPPGFVQVPWSTKADDDPFALMMQNLLAERFKLQTHRESRELPIYELVIAKGGEKLKELQSPAPKPPAGPPVDEAGFPTVPGGDGMRLLSDRGRMQFRWQSMENLAHFISTQVDRPVIDRTGLKGRYALTLSWYRERLRTPAAATSANGSPLVTEPGPGPTIFEAIQNQLGLKLEPQKGAIDMVVIDHVEKIPTEN